MPYSTQSEMSFSLVDELGVRTAATLYALYDPTKTIAQIAADWQTVAALVQAVTGASLYRGRVTFPTALAGAAPAPAVGSRIEQSGVLNFTQVGNPRTFGALVPALLDTVIVGGKINLSDTGVAALVAALGTAATDYEFTGNQFAKLNTLKDAFVSFRKRRKQLRSLTYEL